MNILGYNQLIGKFNLIREYLREFFVYGYKTKKELIKDTLDKKRTYDNHRRRINSWLGNHLDYRTIKEGRVQFISVDSREVIHNPLYAAFKTCTFHDYDVLFHFCLLDLLKEGEWYSQTEIFDRIQNDYFECLDCVNGIIKPDKLTLTNKIQWYVELGVVLKKKGKKRQNFYSLAANGLNLLSWHDAIEFFSETNPLGVIGSFLLDKKELNQETSCFWYKHHYMLYAMESEILEVLLAGIEEKRYVMLSVRRKKTENIHVVYPIKIYVSTQNGREYLVCHEPGGSGLQCIRLDNIITATLQEKCDLYQEYENEYLLSKPYLWGVVFGRAKDIVHIEMTIQVQENEDFLLNRLEREKRNGHIDKINENQYKYVVDTFDAIELMPWIRTFIGRIVKLESSNRYLEQKFQEDMESLYSIYFGGDDNAF